MRDLKIPLKKSFSRFINVMQKFDSYIYSKSYMNLYSLRENTVIKFSSVLIHVLYKNFAQKNGPKYDKHCQGMLYDCKVTTTNRNVN